VKKKGIILLIICIFVSFISFIKPIKAEGYFGFNYLNINKQDYFYDETIIINASWILLYNQENEISYVQIRIYDSLNILKWNSSEYHEMGLYENGYVIEKVMNVSINNLNLNFSNHCASHIITLFYYFKSSIEPIERYEHYGNYTININKKELICELDGLRENIIYGESLSLTARFLDFENQTYLGNLKIIISTYSDNLKLLNREFYMNNTSLVSFSISSNLDLSIGINLLNITIDNFDLYSQKSFIYNIYVEKAPVFIEIIEYKLILKENEDFNLIIYHYYFNGTLEIPLVNHSILFQVRISDSLIYEEMYISNLSGIVYINILNKDLTFLQTSALINISIIVNGTQFLNGNITFLTLEIIEDLAPFDTTFFISILFFFLISSTITLYLLVKLVLLKKKRSSIEDIVFSY